MEEDGIEAVYLLDFGAPLFFLLLCHGLLEIFLENKQIQFWSLRTGIREEALVNYWADEIAKIFKR